MDIIDSHLTGIHKEPVPVLCYHLEVLGDDQVEMVCLVEQGRYRSPFK